MKIFSLSHIIELSQQLPEASQAEYRVLRLPLRDWDAIRDADHPEREFDAHEDLFVEFEVINWKDTHGHDSLRWVLRGLVAV